MATPPPPPAPPAAYAPAYQPPPSNPQGSTTVHIPAWLDFGVFLAIIGGILVLIGFGSGDAYASAAGSAGTSASTLQNDLEGFFVWTGVGVALAIFGWALHVLFPLFMKARKSAGATPAPMYAAPGVAAAPAPAAPSPPSAAPVPVQPASMGPTVPPGAPNCTNCGKPTTYVAQYSRYYCYACARYV